MGKAASVVERETGTKEFPIGAILSVVTGVMVSENYISGVYEILEWMTGKNLTVCDLPAAADAVTSEILRAHPALAFAISEAEGVTPENWREWFALCRDRYGDTLAIPRPRQLR